MTSVRSTQCIAGDPSVVAAVGSIGSIIRSRCGSVVVTTGTIRAKSTGRPIPRNATLR
jgi:hypothetical protein